jgi:predicted DNA-binding transcriptional regulator YafY
MTDTTVFLGLPGVGTRRHLTFTYTNWRGETAVRTVSPRGVTWASTEWHPEPQWLLDAWDVDKREDRLFAMKDMREVRYG